MHAVMEPVVDRQNKVAGLRNRTREDKDNLVKFYEKLDELKQRHRLIDSNTSATRTLLKRVDPEADAFKVRWPFSFDFLIV